MLTFTSSRKLQGEGDRLAPGREHVTADIESPHMTKRNRDLRKRGTEAVTAGSSQVTGLAGRVAGAAGAPWFTGRSRRSWPAASASGRGPGGRCLARGGRHRAGDVRAGVLGADSGRAARRHQRAPGRLGRDRRADGGHPGRDRRGRRAAADALLGPAGAAQAAGGPERAGPGLGCNRRPGAGLRGDARRPRRAGSMRGRVLGVRGRGRDQPGERARPGRRRWRWSARGSSSRRWPACQRRR